MNVSNIQQPREVLGDYQEMKLGWRTNVGSINLPDVIENSLLIIVRYQFISYLIT